MARRVSANSEQSSGQPTHLINCGILVNCRYPPPPPLPAKEDRFQVRTNEKLPFLDIKMSCSPEGGLQFRVFREKGQILKYVGKESTHTPGTLHAIPSGVLNRLTKLTSRKPPLHYEGVDKIYPNHANALREADFAPPNFPTMGYNGEIRMRSWIWKTENNLTSTKINAEISTFVLPTHVISLRPSTG